MGREDGGFCSVWQPHSQQPHTCPPTAVRTALAWVLSLQCSLVLTAAVVSHLRPLSLGRSMAPAVPPFFLMGAILCGRSLFRLPEGNGELPPATTLVLILPCSTVCTWCLRILSSSSLKSESGQGCSPACLPLRGASSLVYE